MYVLKNVYSKKVSKCYASTTNALRFLKNAFSYEYNLIKLIDCTVVMVQLELIVHRPTFDGACKLDAYFT